MDCRLIASNCSVLPTVEAAGAWIQRVSGEHARVSLAVRTPVASRTTYNLQHLAEGLAGLRLAARLPVTDQVCPFAHSPALPRVWHLQVSFSGTRRLTCPISPRLPPRCAAAVAGCAVALGSDGGGRAAPLSEQPGAAEPARILLGPWQALMLTSI